MTALIMEPSSLEQSRDSLKAKFEKAMKKLNLEICPNQGQGQVMFPPILSTKSPAKTTQELLGKSRYWVLPLP